MAGLSVSATKDEIIDIRNLGLSQTKIFRLGLQVAKAGGLEKMKQKIKEMNDANEIVADLKQQINDLVAKVVGLESELADYRESAETSRSML